MKLNFTILSNKLIIKLLYSCLKVLLNLCVHRVLVLNCYLSVWGNVIALPFLLANTAYKWTNVGLMIAVAPVATW